jgi:hypothetical protein
MALIAGKPAVVATTYDSPAQLILASDETGASWQPVQTLGAVGCLPSMLGDPAAGALLAYVGAPDWTAPSVLNWAREF